MLLVFMSCKGPNKYWHVVAQGISSAGLSTRRAGVVLQTSDRGILRLNVADSGFACRVAFTFNFQPSPFMP